eukprot:1069123-Rhodomonas_salina.2
MQDLEAIVFDEPAGCEARSDEEDGEAEADGLAADEEAVHGQDYGGEVATGEDDELDADE